MDLHGLTPVFVVNWHKSGINYDSDFRGFELGWRAVPLRRGPRVGPNGDVVNIMARIRIKHNANELVIKSGGEVPVAADGFGRLDRVGIFNGCPLPGAW